MNKKAELWAFFYASLAATAVGKMLFAKMPTVSENRNEPLNGLETNMLPSAVSRMNDNKLQKWWRPALISGSLRRLNIFPKHKYLVILSLTHAQSIYLLEKIQT